VPPAGRPANRILVRDLYNLGSVDAYRTPGEHQRQSIDAAVQSAWKRGASTDFGHIHDGLAVLPGITALALSISSRGMYLHCGLALLC
jgi:hypothetical protein